MGVKRPTLLTVAERCGVSASTVSRALTRPDVVKPEVRQRILEAATEIGYRPNKLARGLATGRLGRIGLLVPDVGNPFFTELLRVVHHAASTTANCSVLIVNSDERPGEEKDLIRGLLEEVDGVILASPRAPTNVLKKAIGTAPAVLINRPITGRDVVLIDYQDAMAQAAAHLSEHGHRTIAMVRGPSASWAANQRANALTQWTGREGTDLVDLGPRAPTFAAGLESVPSVIASSATAVVAYDDMVASGVIAGLHEAGLRVPEDIAVVGCDDTLLARLLTPSMTTIRPPYAQIAAEAMDLLNSRIAAPTRSARRVTLSSTLVVRASSRAPASVTGSGLPARRA